MISSLLLANIFCEYVMMSSDFFAIRDSKPGGW